MAHISTQQYAPLIRERVAGIGLSAQGYDTHALRRIRAPISYKATGDLRNVHTLLGHAETDSTARYLDVSVDDALALAERTEA